MRLRSALLAVLLAVVPASPALAVSAWYEHYLDARDKLIPAQRWKEAIQALREAQKLKPNSGLDQRTYGMEFEDYLPYYYEGLCLLRTGDHEGAILRFNIEEKNGAIKESPLYRDLVQKRREAEAVRAQLDQEARLKKLREEVDRLRAQSAELHRTGRYEEAQSRLAAAQKAAEALDPGIQRDIQERMQKIREDAARAQAAAEREKKITTDLEAGHALLAEGQPTEAKLRFESVLGLDPQNAAALEGRRRAEDEILARTTAESRLASLARGKQLFAAGRYEEALPPLADAASDPRNTEAQDLLQRARKLIEGLQNQKQVASRIDELMAEAERLMDARKWADAWVRLDTVLGLDKSHVQAQERLKQVNRLLTDETLGRLFPDQPPVLAFLEPRGEAGEPIEVWEKRMDVVGVATDDRGIVRVEVVLGGRVVATQEAPPDPATGELARNLRFDRQLQLEPGANLLKVVVSDAAGHRTERAFDVTRRLPFHQTPAFLPSAAATALGLVGVGVGVQRLRRRRAIRRRFNPYIAGAPVHDEDMFFGRQKLLARILNVLHHNSLMITGERRIGKTTFLFHLKRALEADQESEYRFFPVSTDLQGVPESGFFHALMTDVLDQLKVSPETAGTLRFDATSEGTYDGRDFSHDLQRVIEELKTRTDRKVKLALLIDEVDVLNEYSERVNQRLRSIFMKTFSEHLVAIMSGVGIRRIWNSEGSPWYNFFDEIELTSFSREESEALIREPVEGIFRFDAEAVEAILEHSHLKPYLIQKFCIHAVNRMIEDGRTTV
ncbi:MAG TPA: hypothetical protein VFM29_01210, partial [Vicinamibacteria bacterium]|nr:hypothetical protein [Vicinamibacteria bacterium]